MSVQQVDLEHDFNAEAACVKVFAMVTASVSHEVKNVLAVINENAGLLEDLVMMGGPEQGLPPEHVTKATGTISRQVERANIIMKNCNRLAHLGDRPVSQEPLAEILELMATLATRQADMKNIQLKTECPPAIVIKAPMLPFASIIYLLLRAMIDEVESDSAITVAAVISQQRISLSFGVDGDENTYSTIADQPNIRSFLNYLGCQTDYSGGQLNIRLPSDNGVKC